MYYIHIYYILTNKKNKFYEVNVNECLPKFFAKDTYPMG